jgi:8-oxo-dGTP pyrophosphatase MutT (NUDIX family)
MTANSGGGDPTVWSTAPRDAAGIVLLRETAAGLETLLLRRLQGMQFAAGEWVFPGGSIGAADRASDLARCVANPEASLIGHLRSRALGEPLAEAAALAICIGACRETFEECGILLARHRDGRSASSQLVNSLQPQRALMAEEPGRLPALLERHDLVLTTDTLVYWSNWITPRGVPRRFDTRFFLASLPAGQDVGSHLSEAQAACWLPLQQAAFWASIEPPINAPPTLLTLRELAALYEVHPSLTHLMQVAQTTPPITVMAKIVRRGDARHGLFPWDEAYADAAGEGVICDSALRRRLGRFPSRVDINEFDGTPA